MSKLKKLLTFTLAMIMIVGTLGVGTAAENDVGSADGIKLNKTFDQESGKLTLEAYVTGKVQTFTKTVPIDVVLVLDTSGSMADEIKSYTYTETYDVKSNGEYYYKDSAGYFKRAYYCNYNFLFKHADSWWTVRHYDILGVHSVQAFLFGGLGDRLTPKTSAESEGTQFYVRTETGTSQSKIAALKNAATKFVDNVSEKSPESRISVVDFSSGANIVQDLTTDASAVKNAINNLTAEGATWADEGMAKAKEVLKNSLEGHKKVVVMFTDGEPNHQSGFDEAVANSTISTSSELKADNTTIYTVACFESANSDVIPSDDIWDELQKFDKYMNLVSSNFKTGATSMNSDFDKYYEYRGYYKNASSVEEINDVFEEISDAIGTADVSLGSETVLKDVLTDEFQLNDDISDGSKVIAYTMSYKGDSWEKDKDSEKNLNVSIVGRTINVSGFDFSDNWVGVDGQGMARGKKLVVEVYIKPVEPLYGIYPTNTGDSGIYHDNECIKPFPIPDAKYPYYIVYHVTNNTVTPEKIIYSGNAEKANLTGKVTQGYLYGGAFSNQDCNTVYPFSSGESGVEFTLSAFDKNNIQEFYIWEVPNTYLQPKSITLREHTSTGAIDATGFYAVASIDRLTYKEVGFEAKIFESKDSTASSKDAALVSIGEKWDSGEGSTTGSGYLGTGDVYNEIKVNLKNGNSDTYKVGASVWQDLTTGYLFCADLPKSGNWDTTGNVIEFTPYWITCDNVKVYSQLTRRCEYLGPKDDIAESNYFVNKLSDDGNNLGPSYAAPASASNVASHSLRAISVANLGDNTPDEGAYTLPEGYLNVKYFELGWFKVYGATLLSAVDNGEYSETGFIINGIKYKSDRLIDSYGICTARLLFGSNISNDSKLMMYNLSLAGMKDGDTIVITPYCVSKDGHEFTGTSRTLTYYSKGIKG